MIGNYLLPCAMRPLAVTPRVSALAGCDRFGIRAEGYRECRFPYGGKTPTITEGFQK